MSKITGNEHAMPIVKSRADYDNYTMKTITKVFSEGGLTIRQQFAMAAMQGLLWTECKADECAEKSVEYADALIKELNKVKEVENV